MGGMGWGVTLPDINVKCAKLWQNCHASRVCDANSYPCTKKEISVPVVGPSHRL